MSSLAGGTNTVAIGYQLVVSATVSKGSAQSGVGVQSAPSRGPERTPNIPNEQNQ